MDPTPNYPFVTPSIARGETSSRGVITSSGTGLQTLAGNDFTPSHMPDDPIIFVGSVVKRPKAKPARTIGLTDRDNTPPSEATEQKGDLLICDLCNNGTEITQGMRVVNTDAKSHVGKPPEKCIQEAERAKNPVYL